MKFLRFIPISLISIACGGSAQTETDPNAASPLDSEGDIEPGAAPVDWRGEPLSLNSEGYYDVEPLPIGADPNRDYHQPYIIAEVEAGGATVQFISLFIQSEFSGLERRSVILQVYGDINRGNPVDRLRRATDRMLTSAEIYRGLTGEDTAPVELLELMPTEAADLGQPFDFYSVPYIETLGASESVAEKADFLWVFDTLPGFSWVKRTNVITLFCPNVSSINNCPINNTQHLRTLCVRRNGDDTDEFVGFPQNNNQFLTCSEYRPEFLRVATWNHNRTRFDVLTPSPHVSYTAQQWYIDAVNGLWKVLPALIIAPTHFIVGDWATNAQKKYAISVNRFQNPGSAPYRATGVAMPN